MTGLNKMCLAFQYYGGVVEQRLEGSVLGGVVAEVVLPGAPDDVYPGPGEDSDGVGVPA